MRGLQLQLYCKVIVLLYLLLAVPWVASQMQPWGGEGFSRSSVAEGNHSRNRSDADLSHDATCHHPIWCTIDPPASSLFRFSDPPNDIRRWERAKRLAASGEPVLLQHILPHFPNYFDFLDGDTSMRIYHAIADYFLDNNHGFEVLSQFHPGYRQGVPPRQNALGKRYQPYRWEKNPKQHVLPPPYNLHDIKRAPVIHVGYNAFDRPFSRDTSLPFGGKFIGEAIVERGQLIRMWRYARNKIHRPWIGLHAANENWGLFSSYFPNRTTDWGSCCRGEAGVQLMLQHPMTLLFLTNQHHNLTHPKLLSLPRGLPIHGDHNRRVIFDLMRELASSPSKHSLMFTASSNWGYRPTILQCLSQKFDPSEVSFRLHKNKNLQGRTSFMETYRRIAHARFSIALPGLGYDTFRVWESLTMGTIPILERGIGLDKTVRGPVSRHIRCCSLCANMPASVSATVSVVVAFASLVGR